MSVCSLALVLLLDGSTSIEARDWATQVEQTARAIEAPEVRDAIRREGGVAMTALTFSSRITHDVPWQILRSDEEIVEFAARIRRMRHHYGSDTLLGLAMSRGIEALREAPCQADLQIIDVSTDGRAAPTPMETARDEAMLAGVRINVIVVGDSEDAEFLRQHAVTPDGFVLQADSWDDYPALFRRKIVLEVTGEPMTSSWR